jgi:hypothetical protein
MRRISPGSHEFGLVGDFGETFMSIGLEAEVMSNYYVVLGYNPTASWLFPFGGETMTFEQISRTEAESLLNDFSYSEGSG